MGFTRRGGAPPGRGRTASALLRSGTSGARQGPPVEAVPDHRARGERGADGRCWPAARDLLSEPPFRERGGALLAVRLPMSAPAHRSPLPTRSPLPVARSPLPAPRSPLPVPRFPSPAPRSPLAVLRSPVPGSRSPLFRCPVHGAVHVHVHVHETVSAALHATPAQYLAEGHVWNLPRKKSCTCTCTCTAPCTGHRKSGDREPATGERRTGSGERRAGNGRRGTGDGERGSEERGTASGNRGPRDGPPRPPRRAASPPASPAGPTGPGEPTGRPLLSAPTAPPPASRPTATGRRAPRATRS